MFHSSLKETEMDDRSLKKKLQSAKKSPPRIVSATCCNYVVFDGCMIDVGSPCTTEALLTLIATYYVFGVEYPKIYSQALGLAQTFIVRDTPYAGHQTAGYSKMTAKLYNKLKF